MRVEMAGIGVITQLLGQFEQLDTRALVPILLIVCGVVAIIAFASLFFLTGRSKRRLENDVRSRTAELSSLVAQSRQRIQQLDSMVIDHLRSLSATGRQGYDVLKQTVNVMEQRVADAQSLAESGDFEDLLQAQELLESPLENTGDHLSSVLFSSTVLTLKPDQFGLALDAMYDAVLKDLSEPKQEGELLPPVIGSRKRRFTIRGFLRSLTGK